MTTTQLLQDYRTKFENVDKQITNNLITLQAIRDRLVVASVYTNDDDYIDTLNDSRKLRALRNVYEQFISDIKNLDI